VEWTVTGMITIPFGWRIVLADLGRLIYSQIYVDHFNWTATFIFALEQRYICLHSKNMKLLGF
jgi:hypothetical protein